MASEFYLGHDPSSAFRQTVEDYERKARKHLEAMKQTKDDERYALSAMKGGDNTRFEDEASIAEHYSGAYDEHRAQAIAIRDTMVDKLNENLAMYLKLDVDEIVEMNRILSVCNSDDMLLRFLSDPTKRHYSHMVSISACANDRKELSTAVAVAARMRAFEDACARVIASARGVLLNEQRYYDGAWVAWVGSRIDGVEDACKALDKAVEGQPVDAWTAMTVIS